MESCRCNFVIAMLIAGLLWFVISDVLAVRWPPMTNARSRTAASSAVPGAARPTVAEAPSWTSCARVSSSAGNLHGEVALRSEPDLDDREPQRSRSPRVAADLDRVLRLAESPSRTTSLSAKSSGDPP